MMHIRSDGCGKVDQIPMLEEIVMLVDICDYFVKLHSFFLHVQRYSK